VIRRQFAAAVTAVQFLTRVPLPGGMNRPDPDLTLLRAAVVYFPLVGGLVGVFTGTAVWAGSLVWPPAVAVAVALIAEAALTGAFHEDAVADCCDAFGGGWTRDDVLRILKDSRVGSFGALGLVLFVGLRGVCLAGLPAGEVVAAAACSAALGRWAILLLMAAVPPVPHRDGLGKDVVERAGFREIAIGLLFAAPFVASFAVWQPVRSLGGAAAAGLVVLGWGWYVKGRIGGVTGDCLGCGCYLAQCAVQLAAVAHP
jgi:adenosylcobinamide-GDP ribazoletransferase